MIDRIPVFVIDGLLESGKTTFIKDTIASDDFFKSGKTLVLSCEEGLVEYDDEFLKKYNTIVKYFDNQEDFTVINIQKLVNEIKPKRIVIELNGMWDLSLIEFPSNFKVYQFIYFINYSTFDIYFANMRQKFTDAIKQSEVVVFINVKKEQEEKLEQYSASMRLTNSQAQYFVMDEQGRLKDAFKMVLPYDIESPVIKIEDKDYGIFYIDTFDHKENYENKIVEFKCQAIMSPKLPKNSFVAGRLAMTCCSNDVQLYGHLLVDNLNKEIKDKEWIIVKARVNYEFSLEYNEEECILHPIEINKADAPKEEILDLTK